MGAALADGVEEAKHFWQTCRQLGAVQEIPVALDVLRAAGGQLLLSTQESIKPKATAGRWRDKAHYFKAAVCRKRPKRGRWYLTGFTHSSNGRLWSGVTFRKDEVMHTVGPLAAAELG